MVYGRPLIVIQNLNLPKSMRFPEEGCVQKVAKVRQLTKIKGRTTIFRSNQDTRLMLKSTLIAGQGSSKSKNFCLTQTSAYCHFWEKKNQITTLTQNNDFSSLNFHFEPSFIHIQLFYCFYIQILRIWVLAFFDPKKV